MILGKSNDYSLTQHLPNGDILRNVSGSHGGVYEDD
jgi:hypothetical protein